MPYARLLSAQALLLTTVNLVKRAHGITMFKVICTSLHMKCCIHFLYTENGCALVDALAAEVVAAGRTACWRSSHDASPFNATQSAHMTYAIDSSTDRRIVHLCFSSSPTVSETEEAGTQPYCLKWRVQLFYCRFSTILPSLQYTTVQYTNLLDSTFVPAWFDFTLKVK